LAAKLRNKGYRSTQQRELILGALTGYPRSVEEIMDALKKKLVSIDRVTVYRTLDCFVDLGIVGKTQFLDKTAKFELLNGEEHHHHLVCDNCGSVRDIAFDESDILKKVKSCSDFQVRTHTLEFFGLCANCK